MMERFRRDGDPDATTTTGAVSASEAGATTAPATDERTAELDAQDRDARFAEGEPVRERRFHRDRTDDPVVAAPIDAATLAAARRRQREEYGGVNWGAAFFGFLAAAGLGAILIGIVSAAGATLTLGQGRTGSDAVQTIGLAGGIAMLVALAIAYFAGGYVAGRMSRFDGGRQGLGVWLVALAVTVVLAAAGALLGGKYNVLERLDLPRIPVDEGTIATGAIIALVVAVVGSLVAAMAGGKTGERYHRKVDRVAIER